MLITIIVPSFKDKKTKPNTLGVFYLRSNNAVFGRDFILFEGYRGLLNLFNYLILCEGGA
jgi:hypothetical protein